MGRLTEQGRAFSTAAAAMYEDRCTIQVADPEVTDSLGFSAISYVDSAVSLPCRVTGQVGREVVIDGRVQSVRMYKVRVIAVRSDGTAITIAARNRLNIEPRGASTQRTLDIQEVDERHGSALDVYGVIVNDT